MANKLKINKILESFDFVEWDRFTKSSDHYTFYGWIKRNDSYKDFLILLIYNDNQQWFVTSSEKYSKKIAEMLGQNHSPCKRIEKYFKIKNSIKL